MRRPLFSLILGVALVISSALLSSPTAAQSSIDSTLCDPNSNGAIFGTEGDDKVIHGTDGDDIIFGLGGDDKILGKGGDDIICAGDGNDHVNGGDGNDFISAGAGNDRVNAGDGDDRITGGAGNDTINAGDGADFVDGGSGTDVTRGGDGIDVCLNAERTSGCDSTEPESDLVELSLEMPAECTPEPTVAVAPDSGVTFPGDVVTFEVFVRNDPVGACLPAENVMSTVSGVLEVRNPGDTNLNLDEIAVWLEVADGNDFLVFPEAEGLRTSGGQSPLGCPGGQLEGCGQLIGDQVGNVSYAGDPQLSLPPGVNAVLPFRFFPTLADMDLDRIEGSDSIILVIAASSAADGVQIDRFEINFAPASSTGPLDLTATFPSEDQSIATEGVEPGQQIRVDPSFTYVVQPDDGDPLVAGFAASGNGVSSEETLVEVTIGLDPANQPVLKPAAWPMVVSIDESTEFIVSVAPMGTPSEAGVTVGWPDGTTVANDSGAAGDLVAGDGVWTATFAWAPSDVGSAEISVSSVLDGVSSEGQTTVEVLAVDSPTDAVGLDGGPTIEFENQTFLANRLKIIMSDTATYADVDSAAALIDGTVVGSVGPDVWQIEFEPISSISELEALFASVSTGPEVVGVEPEVYFDLLEIEPNDPEFANQDNLSGFDVPDAWVFQNGDVADPVLIAVIDSGINMDHPDLNGKIVGGVDLIDDDDNPNDDSCLHGTLVAGVAAAETNNGVGIAGVNWEADILPIRITDDDCDFGSWALVGPAIDYAVAQGASIINMSLGSRHRDEPTAQALERATRANRVVVAGAGNTGEREEFYPAAFSGRERFTSWFGTNERFYDIETISVGGRENDGSARWSGSTFGPWVDTQGPAVDILSTFSDTLPYSRASGTSLAAPFVSGVVSLILSDERSLTPSEVRARLKLTGNVALNEDGFTQFYVNPYEAVSNGGFEVGDSIIVWSPDFFTTGGDVAGWDTEGTVGVAQSLGPILPREGQRMLLMSTGPGAAETEASATRTFRVPSGSLADGELTISFWYNYLTEEFPEFVNAGFNDQFTVTVEITDGAGTRTVAEESVDTTAWTPITGIDLPGGDSTLGESGWRQATTTIPAALLTGETVISITVKDNGDAIYDSIALLDDLDVD